MKRFEEDDRVYVEMDAGSGTSIKRYGVFKRYETKNGKEFGLIDFGKKSWPSGETYISSDRIKYWRD